MMKTQECTGKATEDRRREIDEERKQERQGEGETCAQDIVVTFAVRFNEFLCSVCLCWQVI